MRIEWHEHLTVGVPEIDRQHQQLFEKINTLLMASSAEHGSEEVDALLMFLDTYVANHFADEEQLMQKIGFPDFHKHREQHQEFISRLGSLKERRRKEGANLMLKVSVILAMNDWLIKHISGMDRAIGWFLIGVKS